MSDDVTGTDPEKQFPPRPGGLVDTARKQKAREQAAAQAQAEQEAAAAPRPAPRPVTVKIRQPDLFASKTMTLPPGTSALAMPADKNRKRGKVNLVTASASVLIARDRSSADTGTGYTLVAGQPAEEFGHTREVWVANPTDTTVQVSVFTESYDRP